mgnify:CR=1 FL=1
MAVALSWRRFARKAEVDANRRGHREVPLAGVMTLKSLVCEDAGRADLNQVSRELVFEDAVNGAAEEEDVAQLEDVEIIAAGVFTIKTDAALTLDAAIHLLIHEPS